MSTELLRRKDVPEELTWDLSALYKTEEEAFADIEKAEAESLEIEAKYKGNLTTPESINDCLEKLASVYKRLTLALSYTSLAVEVDYYDEENQARNDRASRMEAEIFTRLSFIDSEILEQGDDCLEKALSLATSAKEYLRDLIREKPHRLEKSAEKVMAAFSNTFDAPLQIYNMAKLADMRFPSFTVDDQEYALGYSLYEDDYEYDSRTPVRRAAFDAFYGKLADYVNVTAAAYQTQVQIYKTEADLRGYRSIFEKDLFEEKVDETLYNRQIDLIMEHLAPHMRKFARLLSRVHHLDRMTYADLKVPVDPGYDPKVTIAESQRYIEEGLSILGEDYQEMVREAYRDRWIDFAKNQGKSTGGFCSSPYGSHSFILLNWNERMSDVFTLAHELGHAGHYRACNAAQPIFGTEVSGYFVEAPSTMNELIMGHYLLKTNPDPRFRRWVLSSMLQNTYYHNFVTHLLEADFQRKVYRIVEEGGSFQADTLNRLMRETLETFWGDAVEILPGSELTWMRQPHYYMGLYSYSYSAGLTIATEVCARIEKEGQCAVDDWKKVLAAGGTKTPVELARMAGVDITTDQPLLDTIARIGAMIDEICALTKELETAGIC